MSGWFAIVNLDGVPVDTAAAQRMAEAMAYRGPDGLGTRSFGCAALGHARFAVLADIPAPAAPFTLDGEAWIVGDIRIDAREALLPKLAAHVRAPLAEAADAALVLHAYRVWGERCVEELLGDFAFAIWDVRRQRLFCARDQMGIRPAYVARLGQSLVVSNTLDAMRRHPAWTGALDDTAIVDFLVFGELMDLEATGFADVRRLRAAHVLTAEGGEVSARRYWTLPVEPPVYRKRYGDYLEAIRDVLGGAVRDRLRCARAAISMSGGLDSTAVAAMARQVRPEVELRAFTCVFERLIPDDERHFATMAARHLGVPISFIVVDDRQPFSDEGTCNGPVPEHNPWRGASLRERATMAGAGRTLLTGYGADPALLPWPADLRLRVPGRRVGPMAVAALRQIVRRRAVPLLGLRWRRAARRSDPRLDVAVPAWLSAEAAQVFDARARLSLRNGGTDVRHPWRENAHGFLSNEYWSCVSDAEDPGVNGVLLATAHPFLDVRVLQSLLTLPSTPFVGDKRILRDALAGALPRQVTERRKTPLRVDPLEAALDERTTAYPWAVCLSPLLGRYVDGAQFDVKSAFRAGGWQHVTPLSINRWMRAAVPESSECDLPVCSTGELSASTPSTDGVTHE